MRTWVRWQDWVNVVAGLWMFVSPWVLATSGVGSVAWSAWIIGVLVVIVGLWALAAPSSQGAEWCNVVLGICAIVVPWVLGFSGLAGATWSMVVAGLVVLVLSGWVLYGMRQNPQMKNA